VLAAALEARREPQETVAVDALGRDDAGQLRLALKGGAQVARFDDLPVEYVLTGQMPVVETADAGTPPPHGEPGHHH
jgi:hypothetical protein